MKNQKKMKITNFSKFTDFSIFFSPQKHKIYQKLSKFYSPLYRTSLILYKTELTSTIIIMNLLMNENILRYFFEEYMIGFHKISKC